jgi:hypothetical protein
MVPQDRDGSDAVRQSPAMTTRPEPGTAATEWSDLAERTEALAMQRMMLQQAPATVELLGVSAPDLADGVHTVVVRDPMWGYWNKALGFCSPVDAATVDEAVSRARDQRVPAFAFQVQPRAVPDDWSAIARRHGLTEGTTFVKCFGPAEPRGARTDLRISRLAADDAASFTQVLSVGFGFEETAEAHALFDGPQYFDGDWAAYGAYDGDVLVAAARRPTRCRSSGPRRCRQAATAARRVRSSTRVSVRRGTVGSATRPPRPGSRARRPRTRRSTTCAGPD